MIPNLGQELRIITKYSAYRAPELLFGTRDYQPIALDLWSLGACLAEFFTPLRLCCDDMDMDQSDEEKDENVLKAFVVPERLRVGYPNSYWQRNSFFEGSRGEIGLAWSIFKIFGTPTEESWPVSDIAVIFSGLKCKFLRNMRSCLAPSLLFSTSYPASLLHHFYQIFLRLLRHKYPWYWIFLPSSFDIHQRRVYQRKMLFVIRGSRQAQSYVSPRTIDLIIPDFVTSFAMNLKESHSESC